MKYNKLDTAIFDCYRELFANSTPKGDFDELVENATINERGQKVIPFDQYVLGEDKFAEIINETLSKHKIPKRLHSSFRAAIYLGCSPKTIK